MNNGPLPAETDTRKAQNVRPADAAVVEIINRTGGARKPEIGA
jgi:hypothetical protein